VKPTSSASRVELPAAVRRYAANLPRVIPYLIHRGILVETAERFLLGFTGDDPMLGHPAGRLSIPCLAFDNHPVFLSFRAVEDDDKPKYLHMHGDARLFNSRAIVEADDCIHITEGQLDAIVLEQCGFHAVGIMGASAWKAHHPRMFAGFTNIYVWADSDSPGQELARKVCDSLRQAQVVKLGNDVKDVNELWLKCGLDGIQEAYRNAAA
jgi:DNA primase